MFFQADQNLNYFQTRRQLSAESWVNQPAIECFEFEAVLAVLPKVKPNTSVGQP